MPRTAKPPGALVVGGDHPGLGIARSLGRRGIPVYILDDQPSIAKFSRYATRVIRAEELRNEEQTVEAVLAAGRKFNLRDWVLFPTRDETVAAFSRHRDRLRDLYRVTTPAWGTTEWAWNKRKSYELAAELGIPCPRTVCAAGAHDLKGLESRLPLAIKPAIKEHFFYATGAKAWRAETPGQLQALYERAARQIPPEEILLQEIIPGDGCRQYSYCAFFRNGEAHSSLVACRYRQHPREFGRAATYVETVDAPAVEELAQRFLRAIDYYGLVEIEFKLDTRDGQYKLLDVNARTWGFHILGQAAGVDFPYLLYADQIGESVGPCRGEAGIGWLRLLTDVPTAFSEIVQGRTKINVYIESLRRTRVEAVFCRKDPLPSLAEFFLLPYVVAHQRWNARRGISSHAQR